MQLIHQYNALPSFRVLMLILFFVFGFKFIEKKHKQSLMHILDSTPLNFTWCIQKCIKNKHCQGFSFNVSGCKTYYFVPDYALIESKESIYVKDELYNGLFHDDYLVIPNLAPKNCYLPLCDVISSEDLEVSLQSTRIKADFYLKFEEYPLIMAPSQYWKNITANTTIYDCLSQCDSYEGCLAVQYVFNDTMCAMLDVWPGEFIEINKDMVTSTDYHAELFLKIDHHSLGYSIHLNNNQKYTKLKEYTSNTIIDCLQSCNEISECEYVYYNTICHLLTSGDVEITFNDNFVGNIFVKIDMAQLGLSATLNTTKSTRSTRTTAKFTFSRGLPDRNFYSFSRSSQFLWVICILDYVDYCINRIYSRHDIFLLLDAALEYKKKIGKFFNSNSSIRKGRGQTTYSRLGKA